MHIAIDDTYGPPGEYGSKYVTGNRRTHVAVVFPDDQVDAIRNEMRGCIEEVCQLTAIQVSEFHFVDIFNRKKPWDDVKENFTLGLFEMFGSIFRTYRWPVILQTVDNRTLADHGFRLAGRIGDIDLSDPSDLSLQLLLIKIKIKYKSNPEPIRIIIDEGKQRAGTKLGKNVFHDWPEPFKAYYESSRVEPLLQIADFFAYCINRSTHLSLKKRRTETDLAFMNFVARLMINSDDLTPFAARRDFDVNDFDELHRIDRKKKGLE